MRRILLYKPRPGPVVEDEERKMILEIGIVIASGVQIEAYLLLRILYLEWRPWEKAG